MMVRRFAKVACLAALLHYAFASAQMTPLPSGTMSFVFRDAPVAELFEMLSRQTRTNIVLSRGVSGNVTVNLYDMTAPQAIQAIAEAAGYFVEQRNNGYFISDKKGAFTRSTPPNLEMRTFRVQYSNPAQIAEVLAKYSTPDGKLTLLEDRRMLVVEDTPDVIARMERIVKELDRQPLQIMIEAKILEISLDNSETFGVDWARILNGNGSRVGTQGLASRTSPGLFFRIINSNVEAFLSALSDKGRVRALATPKLLTMENQEAVTNVGDKIGYRLTTTINNVTTESVQFLDTGIILRVIPSVDANGRIAMRIRPEVSSGSVSGGIPSKKTTEVSTQLVAENGQSILIAGLIKSSESYRRTGVPVVGDLPGIGRLFSATEEVGGTSETIVLITPRIVEPGTDPGQLQSLDLAAENALRLDTRNRELKQSLDQLSQPGY